ncbi:serine/threonine protein kinase, partial [Myxococcota bacterium]
MTTKLPLRFGNYLLLDLINTGGMAEVYRAKTFGVGGFEKIIALKRILPQHTENQAFVDMIIDEARIAAQLTNKNIAQIYELGVVDGEYYIAMEYVPGQNVRQLLDHLRENGERLPIPYAAFVASCVCFALQHAHRKCDRDGEPLGIIHRDVTPHNVLISYDGEVKVVDFGIARAMHRITKTQAGLVKGKMQYLSPEQVRPGMPIDRRSDIFGVGLLFFEMLTGEPQFSGSSNSEILEMVRDARITKPTDVIPDLPESVERVVLKALAGDRDARHQWADELHDDLQPFLIEKNTIIGEKSLATFIRQHCRRQLEMERRQTAQLLELPASADIELTSPDIRQPGAADGTTADGNTTIILSTGDLIGLTGDVEKSGVD